MNLNRVWDWENEKCSWIAGCHTRFLLGIEKFASFWKKRYMYAAGMTIMAVSVGEICENTKLAREMALMGNYESALVYYEGTVQMIHRLLITIADPTRRSKWQLVSQGKFSKALSWTMPLTLYVVTSLYDNS